MAKGWNYTDNDQLLMVKLTGDPVDVMVVVIYIHTTDHLDEEVEEMYDDIEEILNIGKGNDYQIILGDFNAVSNGLVAGSFGLGRRNKRGVMLVEFCERRNLMIANTCFEYSLRRRYSWTSPEDTRRLQIDYILVKQRYRNSVKNAASYPGADCYSDHNLVMMKLS